VEKGQHIVFNGTSVLERPSFLTVCSQFLGVRLVGGSRCSGRVEVLHGETWFTVCDAEFNQQDAEVVCRELGCGSPVLGSAAFGRGEGQMWSEELQCRGSESDITLCSITSSHKYNCSHDNDVGLVCSGTARLMNGSDSCSGRVELQYLSEWGTVCDVSWDMRAASVLCAQLKCGSAVAVLGSDWFGEGSVRIWADVFDCQGNETHLSKCPISSWSRTACSHKQDVGVICSSLASHEGGVRLSGGMECEGEVEVFFRQDWRRVLLDSWSESEASVVCRQLGCGSVLNISSSSSSSPEHSYMCVTRFNCSGSEAHLRNCSSAQAVNCSSTEQLYITCSGTLIQIIWNCSEQCMLFGENCHGSIRLVGSGGDCAGRLEVFHSGSWGTVSDELWDIEDAQVVCRQLQCGVALSAPVPVPARFGSGTGPIWLNEVECEGNEASLWNCRYQLCGEDECGHKDDVGVVCSEYKEIRLTEGCEGNLEVFYNGTWGNVCGNGMDVETVSLICRELKCGRTGSERATKARVESAPNWLDDVKCRKHDSTLFHCPSSSWSQNNCDNSNEVAHITCSEHLPLQLRGGEGHCSGMLEVYHNAEWGCCNVWSAKALGCGPALSANRRAAVGSGGGTIWMNRVKCRGNEIHLWDCPHSLKNHADCSHSAGVTCADSVSVKLVDGGSRCAGRVEILYREQWGTVCEAFWDMKIAAVACRELGCGEAVDVVTSNHFGQGSGHHWQYPRICNGLETTIDKCGTRDVFVFDPSCDHLRDVGIICSEVWLVNGSHCSGRVEVLHGESWVTVCDADFDQQDAEVVCRELGCGSPVEVLGAAAFGRGEGQVWSEELQCRGNESQIHFCPKSSSLKHNCSHDNDVGLVCAENRQNSIKSKGCSSFFFCFFLSLFHLCCTGGVRLVDGGSRCAGRVEVLHRGQWGTVCGDDWDMSDAAVVCRELGCGEAVDALSESHFGSGSGQIWMDNVDCSGSESTLKNCRSPLWGKHNCNKTHNSGVICSGVRLVGGSRCSGRVEVLHRGQWGTVCGDDWDMSDAAVVCRELGCGEAVDALSESHFGSGSGQIWMDNVDCSGSESTLKNCRSPLWGKHNCNKTHNSGVIFRLVGGSRCSGRVEVLHKKTWFTVCDADFNQQGAEVVCRELGCGSPVEVLGAAAFGRGEGQVWSEELQCRGNESQIHFCLKSSSLKHNCSHDEDGVNITVIILQMLELSVQVRYCNQGLFIYIYIICLVGEMYSAVLFIYFFISTQPKSFCQVKLVCLN
uniref:SRCR domain-containing protein n=1 Tax=Astyanax mexicanus TaxID=7994 RepID=W5K1C0_ASTMX